MREQRLGRAPTERNPSQPLPVRLRPNICCRRHDRVRRVSDGVHDPVGDWSIVVDRDVCIGSGVCIVYAPHTFAHDRDSKAYVVDAPGDAIDVIRTATTACPTGALRLVAGDDKETS